MLSIRQSVIAFGVISGFLLSACESERPPAETAPLSAAAEIAAAMGELSEEELYGARSVENLWSPRVELEVLDLPRGWDGARIAVLSDMQLGRWGENEEVAVGAVRAAIGANPDIIVLIGDFLAPGGEPSMLDRVLSPLRGRRTFAVLGTMDVRSDSVEATVVGALEAQGIQLLRTASVPVELRGDSAWIAGLDPAVVPMALADQQWVLSTLGETGRTPILLTHVPAMATRAPTGRFPVVLAGNVFCGEVEVPETPRRSWVRTEVFPGAEIEGTERLFRVQGSTVVLTCGLGYGFVPVRFGAPPEVPIITLVRVGDPAGADLEPLVPDTLIQRFEGTPPPTDDDG